MVPHRDKKILLIGAASNRIVHLLAMPAARARWLIAAGLMAAAAADPQEQKTAREAGWQEQMLRDHLRDQLDR